EAVFQRTLLVAQRLLTAIQQLLTFVSVFFLLSKSFLFLLGILSALREIGLQLPGSFGDLVFSLYLCLLEDEFCFFARSLEDAFGLHLGTGQGSFPAPLHEHIVTDRPGRDPENEAQQ